MKAKCNQCGAELSTDSKFCIHCGQQQVLLSCPYCGEIQSGLPKRRKTKCAACRNITHLRYRRWTNEQGTSNYFLSDPRLVKDDEVWKYDWVQNLVGYGITIDYFEQRRMKTLSDRDCAWSILNELLNQFMKRSEFRSLSHIYQLMAKFLMEENKDPLVQLQQAHRMSLLQMKQEGYRKVVVMISNRKADPIPCPVCLSWEKRVLVIDDALRLLPLPPVGCQNKYCESCFSLAFTE